MRMNFVLGVMPKKISNRIFLLLAAIILIGGFFVVSYVLAAHTTAVSVDKTLVKGGSTKTYTFSITNAAGSADKVYFIKITAPVGFTVTGGLACPEDTDATYDWTSNSNGANVTCQTSISNGNSNLVIAGETVSINLNATAPMPLSDTDYNWSVYTEDRNGENSTNALAVTQVDVTAPTIISATTKDTDGDGRVETATLVFSENVDDITFAAGNFILGGVPVTNLSSGTENDNTFDIIVAGGVAGTEAKEVIYNQGAGIDIVGNLLANVTSGTVAETDVAAPVLLSARTTATNKIKLTFSEDLNGSTVTNADFSAEDYPLTAPDASELNGVVTLTTASNFGTGDKPAVTYNTTASNGVKDLSSNQAPAAGPLTPADGVAPLIASTRTVTTASIEVIFTEEMSAVDKDDFTVAGNVIASVTFTAGQTTAILVLQNAIGTDDTPLVSIIASPVNTKDNASVANTIAGSLTSTPIDDIAPTVILNSTAVSPTNDSPIPLTAAFSENVTGFTAGDITITNGVLNNFAGSGAVYTFEVTPAGQGAVTVNIAGAVAKDAADNDNEVAAQFSITYDSFNPTVGLTNDQTDLVVRDADTVVITATFNETMTDAPTISLDVLTDDITNAVMSGAGTTWTYTWDVPAGNDGAAVATVAGADLAGNPYAGGDDLTFIIDNTNPTPVSEITPGATPNSDNTPEIVIKVETTVGWEIKNGEAVVNSEIGAGAEQTVTLNTLADGLYDLDLLAMDTAGNETQIALSQFLIDTTAPNVDAGADKLSNVQFTQNATASDNGSGILSYLWTKVSGPSVITFGTATAEDTTISANTDGVYVIGLTVTDNAGNSAYDEMTLIWDTTALDLVIVLADPALKVGETSLVSFTFSEPVIDFNNIDITTIDNGILTGVSSTDGGTTWTAIFTPTDGMTDNTNVITVDKTGVTDLAGNAGVGSTGSNNYEIDTVRPTITIELADSNLIAGETTIVTFTFSEIPTGFAADDVTVGSGAIGAIDATNPLVQTAIYTPTANIENDTNVITVGTDWTDQAGNTPAASTNSVNYTVETKKPTVILASATVSPTNGLIAVTAEFSEDVFGFDETDITIGNGAVENFVAIDGDSYTFNVNPTDGANIVVTIEILADKATDAAGNGNTASNQLSYTSDTMAPDAPVIISIAGDDFINDSEKAEVQVIGTAEAGALVNISLTSGATVNGSGIAIGGNYDIIIDATLLNDGTVTPSVTATDAAGNESVPASATALKDTVAPVIIVNDGTSSSWAQTETINLIVTEINPSLSKYGFSPDSTCSDSDNINTNFTSDVGFDIAGDLNNYLCAKAADMAGNETYLLVGQLKTDNTAPTLTLNSLFTGQTLTGGNIYPINWTAADLHLSDLPIKLEYSINGGTTWTTIAETTTNDGAENWTVPSVNTSNGLVRITATDLAGNISQADSNTFSITYSIVTDATAPVATLNSPNGGETWENNSAHLITWTATDNLTAAANLAVKLEYSINGGGIWTTIAATTENDGAYFWTPSGVNSTNVLIKVTANDAANLIGSDINNTALTIATPASYPESICAGSGPYSCSISLSTGWNLISFPIIPTNTAIATVLLGISGVGTSTLVRYYDAGTWKSYIPSKEGGTLTNMGDGKGYWINMTNNATLTVSGTSAPVAPNPPSTYDVISGWNLIGYKSLTAYKNASAYLSTIPAGYIVFDQNNTNKTSSYLQHGKGYWLWSTGVGSIVAGG